MKTEAFELPSGRQIEIREMTGADEKALIDKALLKAGRHLDVAMSGCIVSLDGAAVDKKDAERLFLDMLTGDRSMVFLKSRILSFGPKLEFSYRCPICGKWGGYSVDLQEMLDNGGFKILPYRDDVPVRLELSTGSVVEMGYSTGSMERALRTRRDPDIVDMTMAQVFSVDTQKPKRTFFEALPSSDLDLIRTAADDLTGGLVPMLELECDGCDSVYNAPFGAIPDFFIQRRTSKAGRIA